MNNKMKKRNLIITAVLLLTMVFFTACGGNKESNEKVEEPKDQQVSSQEKEEPLKDGENENGNDQVHSNDYVTLYIGYPEMDFKEVKVKMDPKFIKEHNFDEHLLGAIADETGWNLELANPIEDIDGGKTISFTENCALKAGPPETQKDEYFAYDNYSLAQMILGSIQKTFDMNMTDGKDAHSLDLYFDIMGDSIIVEDQRIPFDKPWNEIDDKLFN